MTATGPWLSPSACPTRPRAPGEIFAQGKTAAVHQVRRGQQAAARQGTQATKNRGRGPGRGTKPYTPEGHRPRSQGSDPRAAGQRPAEWCTRTCDQVLRAADTQDDEAAALGRREVRPAPTHGRVKW